MSVRAARVVARTASRSSTAAAILGVLALAVTGSLAVPAFGQAAPRARPRSVAVTATWPQFHNGPDRTGLNILEKVITLTSTPGLKVKWSFPTGNIIDQSSPAVVGGRVFIGSTDHKLYALNASTGALDWSATTGGAIESSPAVANGIVYVGSDDGSLYAYDAATGAPRWSAATGDAIGPSSPAVANGLVFIGSLDGKLHAYDATTGGIAWTSAGIFKIRRSPSVANGIVYVGTDAAKLYAFNATDGTPLWNQPTGGLIRDTPMIKNGIVYVGADDGKLYAFDATTGAPKWTTPALSVDTWVRSTPAFFDGKVYIDTGENSPSGSHLYAFDAVTGAPVWNNVMGDFSTSSPAIAGGVVFAGSSDTQVYGFNAETGAKIWTSGFGTIGAGMTSSPAIVGGTLYIGAKDGKLYALRDLTPPQVTFDSTPPAFTPSTTASFTFHTDEPAKTMTCSVDGGTSTSCLGGTYSASGLTEGQHTMTVVTTDTAGNTGRFSVSWTVDHTPPVVTITKGPNGTVNTGYTTVNTASFQMTSSEPLGGFKCQLDSAPQVDCNGFPSYTGLPDGSHTFTAWSYDQAGNLSAPQSRSWIQDTVPPTVTASGPTGTIHTDTATFTFSAYEPVTFKCAKDGGSPSTCTSPFTMGPGLAEGAHSFAVFGIDAASNRSSTVTKNFTVDTPPKTTITGKPPSSTTSTTAQFTFTVPASQGPVTFTCALDGGAGSTCTSPKTYNGLSVAKHTFTVFATDQGGNVGPTAQYSWTIKASASAGHARWR